MSIRNIIVITIAIIMLIYAGYVATAKQPLSSETISYANAVKKSAPAVVSIIGLGSGVIIDNQGHILTNKHVIDNAQQIIVKLTTGQTILAELVGSDPQTDLAVLRIQAANLPVITTGDSNKLQVGDIVLAIGNPYGLHNTVTQGIVSAIGVNQDIELGQLIDNLIQTDAAINIGNSGGALIDVHGKIIGINTAIMANINGSQGIGFAIPIITAKQIAQQIITNGHVTRGWIGTQLSKLPSTTKQYLQYHGTNGIYVQDILRNSPAQISGILPGDIITKINNTAAIDILQSIRLISALTPNQTYDIEIFRNGKNIIYPVTVQQRTNQV